MNPTLLSVSSHLLNLVHSSLHLLSVPPCLFILVIPMSLSCYHSCSYSLMRNDNATTISCVYFTFLFIDDFSLYYSLSLNEVWFGLVLWHINHCRLLNAKSSFIHINSSISNDSVQHKYIFFCLHTVKCKNTSISNNLV